MFEDTIGIIRSSKSKGRKYNGEKKNVKRQSVQHKILHRKLKIKQYEPTKHKRESGIPEK
jgi:hypothetical protein